MGCGEQVTNCRYFIQSSVTLHSLHFELSRISLSVPLDYLLYHLLLRQSSVTVHVRRSTHLLLFHDALFIIRRLCPKGTSFKRQVKQRVGKPQVEVCERRGKSFINYFKGPLLKGFEETRLMTIPFTCEFRLRPVSYFSLPSY